MFVSLALRLTPGFDLRSDAPRCPLTRHAPHHDRQLFLFFSFFFFFCGSTRRQALREDFLIHCSSPSPSFTFGTELMYTSSGAICFTSSFSRRGNRHNKYCVSVRWETLIPTKAVCFGVSLWLRPSLLSRCQSCVKEKSSSFALNISSAAIWSPACRISKCFSSCLRWNS